MLILQFLKENIVLIYTLSKDTNKYLLYYNLLILDVVVNGKLILFGGKWLKDLNGIILEDSVISLSSFENWMGFLFNFVNSSCFVKHS